MTTPKKNRATVRERRRLFYQFRKQTGVTLDKFGEVAELSKSMLSRFEAGHNDLSVPAWSRVLEAMSKLVQGHGNLKWNPVKRVEGIQKAHAIAAQLGVNLSQSITSPTLEERLMKYFGVDVADYAPAELLEVLEDVLDIARQAVRDNAIVRNKEQYWRARIDEIAPKYHELKDILGLKEKRIVAEAVEQERVDALGLEKTPPAEHDTWRTEIEEHSKKRKIE